MVTSRLPFVLALSVAFASAGPVACSVGSGDGQVSGVLSIEKCSLRNSNFALAPDFFTAEAVEEQTFIRIQRGGDTERFSDGVLIRVADASALKRDMLGVPVAVGTGDTGDVHHDVPVALALYLNDTCREVGSAALYASNGTITFQALYAPQVDSGSRLTEASFETDIADPEDPENDHGHLSGSFRFFYTRGRPAQPFP